MDEQPTIYEALQALEVVIRYAQTTFEFHQDSNLLIQLGRVNEKLEKGSSVPSPTRERATASRFEYSGCPGLPTAGSTRCKLGELTSPSTRRSMAVAADCDPLRDGHE